MKEIFKTLIVHSQEQEYKNIIKRDSEFPLDSGKIVSLVGVRRSGKSSLFFEKIECLRKSIPKDRIVYINFEDDRIFPTRLQDLESLIVAYYELYPQNLDQKVYLFLDEIQNIENWEKFVRRVYDTQNIQLFITGSSSKLLSSEIATALRGRTLSYEVMPLSFGEFLRFKQIEVKQYSQRSQSHIANALELYLHNGGFPENVFLDSDSARKNLHEYSEMIIYKDLIERYALSNSFLLKYLLKHCFVNIATKVSINKLYNDFKSQGISLSKNTLYDYFSLLQEAFVIFGVSKKSESVKEEFVNPKKIYAIDVGFKNIMDHHPQKDMGRILENIVYLELRRGEKEPCYFEKKQEVDFYYEDRDGKHLINVCLEMRSIDTRKRELEGLFDGMKQMGADKAVIITKNESERVEKEGRIVDIVPLWKWLVPT